jgi:hypothetical protein
MQPVISLEDAGGHILARTLGTVAADAESEVYRFDAQAARVTLPLAAWKARSEALLLKVFSQAVPSPATIAAVRAARQAALLGGSIGQSTSLDGSTTMGLSSSVDATPLSSARRHSTAPNSSRPAPPATLDGKAFPRRPKAGTVAPARRGASGAAGARVSASNNNKTPGSPSKTPSSPIAANAATGPRANVPKLQLQLTPEEASHAAEVSATNPAAVMPPNGPLQLLGVGSISPDDAVRQRCLTVALAALPWAETSPRPNKKQNGSVLGEVKLLMQYRELSDAQRNAIFATAAASTPTDGAVAVGRSNPQTDAPPQAHHVAGAPGAIAAAAGLVVDPADPIWQGTVATTRRMSARG